MAPRNTQLTTDLPLQGHLPFAEGERQNMHQQQRPATSNRGLTTLSTSWFETRDGSVAPPITVIC